ncbi:MAG: Zn-dependent protease with chaperone function [Verrucomicrobiales bacterium]|nr:Zn-dependent protease with chaperone function [Verrucomicrobiales bacterium]
MDFFQNQEDARRRTRRLLVLFFLSVAAITVIIYIAAGFATGWRGGLLDWGLLGMVAAGTGLVIGAGSGFKTLQLSAGGSVVARDLGGRPVPPDSTQRDERRLLNVVEEMALAAGTPVPAVWILDQEEGINAFAAGHTPSDAVIGVTRGCLRSLTRDELQGVIAHEFSHILNGDMRLNLRLIGVVYGLLVLAILGRIVLRVAAETRGGRSRSDSKSIDPRMVLLLAGAGMLVAGYLGVFFGNLIKAAISRQREFLADAAAVQFTRNPDSIGGALLKIGGYTYGSELKTPRAEEASHLMFSHPLSSGLLGAMASHPPLEKRIRAILPHWDGTWPKVSLPDISAQSGLVEDDEVPPLRRTGHPSAPVSGLQLFPQSGVVAATTVRAALDRIGQPTEQDVASARIMGGSIPSAIRQLIRDPAGAQAVIIAMLLAKNPDARQQAEPVLADLTDENTAATVREAAGILGGWHSSQLIAVLDLALPSLRRLTPAEYGRFSHILQKLIAADGRMDLFEFMLQKMVRRHLDHFFHRPPPPAISLRNLADAAAETSTLLSAFASLGGPPPSPAHSQAMQAAAASLRASGVQLALTSGPPTLDRIDAALNRFDRALPEVKRQLLDACAAAALADGRLSSGEAELLRAAADTIGCPIPPFVSGPPVAGVV